MMAQNTSKHAQARGDRIMTRTINSKYAVKAFGTYFGWHVRMVNTDDSIIVIDRQYATEREAMEAVDGIIKSFNH